MNIATGTGNTYGRSSFTLGESTPVWRSIDPNGKWQGGGVIQNLPTEGTVIQTGHPVQIDTLLKTAKLCNVFNVYAAVGTGDSAIKVSVLPGLPRLKQGNFIGVPPAAATGTTTAIVVGAVTKSDGYDQITITPNALGALAQNSLLVECAASGAGAKQYAIPNALVYEDVYIGEGVTVATCAGVHTGTVYAYRAPLMSAGIIANLPGIKFDYSL